MAKKVVKVTMEHSKETKGTHQYKEDGDQPKIGTIYVPKRTLKDDLGEDQPDEITVSISIPE